MLDQDFYSVFIHEPSRHKLIYCGLWTMIPKECPRRVTTWSPWIRLTFRHIITEYLYTSRRSFSGVPCYCLRTIVMLNFRYYRSPEVFKSKYEVATVYIIPDLYIIRCQKLLELHKAGPCNLTPFTQKMACTSQMKIEILPWKLTCPVKINGWKMYSLLK